MKMTDREKPVSFDIDALLAEAAGDRPKVPASLTARVMQDADRLQPKVMQLQRAPVSLFARLGAALGGWPAVGGLAAASCAGFWIGFSPPDTMLDAGALLVNQTQGAFYDEAAELSGYGWDLEEG